jgi:hypothetical protein
VQDTTHSTQEETTKLKKAKKKTAAARNKANSTILSFYINSNCY